MNMSIDYAELSLSQPVNNLSTPADRESSAEVSSLR
ncbi:hypothetical protein PCAR4_140070 [Paraburkholderia caribensis]|nr:hypothetical protein PCAR4_140070 [Paraburkholderia caribensis]